MDEKLEIDFHEPLIGLLIINLQNLAQNFNQKKSSLQLDILNILDQLDKFETEEELNIIKNNWTKLKTKIELEIDNLRQKHIESLNLVQLFLISNAFFDLLTMNNPLFVDLQINLENQEIDDYKKLINLMKRLAIKQIHQNYIIFEKLWMPLNTSKEFKHLVEVSIDIDDYLDFVEYQKLFLELLNIKSEIKNTINNWKYLDPLMTNEAINNFIDFFESNLETIDEESHLKLYNVF